MTAVVFGDIMPLKSPCYCALMLEFVLTGGIGPRFDRHVYVDDGDDDDERYSRMS